MLRVLEHISISQELSLLAACDLADDGALAAKIDAAVRSNFDWDRFADLACQHAMAGLVADRMGRLAQHAVPLAIARSLGGYLQTGAVLQLSQTATSVGLTRALEQAGVRSIVLKGMALAHMLYPGTPHWRVSTDIDLLIASEDLAAADRVLREAGFDRRWPSADPPERGRDMFLLLANVYDYVHPRSGELIELHHRITLNPHWTAAGFDELYRTSAVIATAQGPIRGLDGAQLVSYLCWHAFAHAGFRVKWFCDIVRALRRTGARTGAELCPAEAGFPQRHIELADVLVAAILAQGLDEHAAGPVPAAAARWRHQVQRIIADMEAPHDLPTTRSLALLPGEVAFRLFLARLSPGAKGKAYELLRATSDPRDVSLLRLGARFAPLYVLVGPVLAIRRYVLALAGREDALPHLH